MGPPLCLQPAPAASHCADGSHLLQHCRRSLSGLSGLTWAYTHPRALFKLSPGEQLCTGVWVLCFVPLVVVGELHGAIFLALPAPCKDLCLGPARSPAVTAPILSCC